jgi:hypothetical protein
MIAFNHVGRFVIGIAILAGCTDEPRPDENAASCDACPACAASMVCLDGASLACEEREFEPYSPIACVRADGTKHGQYKSFEWIEDHWIETDGWYVHGKPVGDWVSVDALGRVVKVTSYVDGQPVERPLTASPTRP